MSASFIPVSRLDGVTISNGVYYTTGPTDWGYDMERRENWVSMYHLDRVLNLYILIDLVIYLAGSGWSETFQKFWKRFSNFNNLTLHLNLNIF